MTSQVIAAALAVLMVCAGASASVTAPDVTSVSDDPQDVAKDLGQRIAAFARASSAPSFMVALSGGSALDMAGRGLAEFKDDVSLRWDTWQVFLVDERCVSIDHPDSNFGGLVKFAQQLPLNPNQLFPGPELIETALQNGGCKQLAHDYAGQLRGFAMPPDVPRFDVVVLGIGPDGHTASLFPGSPTGETSQLVLHVEDSPKPPAHRVSLSLPLINHAKNVLVAAVGESKKAALAQTLCELDSELPISLVAPTHGEIDFLIDRAAAPACLRGVHLVWFGARGSLAKKYTWRMLLNLFQKGSLGNALVHAVGSDAYEKGVKLVQELAHQKLKCLGESDSCLEQADAFLQQLSYVQLTRTKDQDQSRAQYSNMNDTMHQAAAAQDDPVLWPQTTVPAAASPRMLFYLSVPPSAYVSTIKRTCSGVLGARPWPEGSAFVIEKPFGDDLADVRARQLSYSEAGVREDELWRLDHYLGKAGVRNMLHFRRQNPLWELHWSGEHIARIEVVVQETENVHDRVDYYGESGAVRDMMVNHLMAIVATAAMALPKDAADAGAKRASFMQQLEPVTRDSMLVSQYNTYREQLADHYASNPTARKVTKAEQAPSGALVVMKSSDPHWAGTEFVLAHAKATDVRQAYATIIFKDQREVTFHIQGGSNDEFVAVKSPPQPLEEPSFELGTGWVMAHPSKDLWVARPQAASLNAYEALYGDAFKGDKSHFVTYAEVEAAYQVWDSVLDYASEPQMYPEGATLNQIFNPEPGVETLAFLSEPPQWSAEEWRVSSDL